MDRNLALGLNHLHLGAAHVNNTTSTCPAGVWSNVSTKASRAGFGESDIATEATSSKLDVAKMVTVRTTSPSQPAPSLSNTVTLPEPASAPQVTSMDVVP